MKNFVILRVEKLKTAGNIVASGEHTLRERPTPNADPNRTPLNINRGAATASELLERVMERVGLAEEKAKDDPVLCLEYLVTASPEALAEKSEAEQLAYFDDAMAYLEQVHGKENIVLSSVQRDEKTMHLAVYAVPLVQKTERTRKRSVIVGTNPDGTKKRETREMKEAGKLALSAKHFCGGRKKLSALQTDFSKSVGERHGLRRGIEGSTATHERVKRFYGVLERAHEPLPELPPLLPPLRPEPPKPGLFSSQAVKDDYEAWTREKRGHQKSARERNKLLGEDHAKTRDLAVSFQTRSEEFDRVRAEKDSLKTENLSLKTQVEKLTGQVARQQEILNLFHPEEIQAARIRRDQEQAAEIARIERELKAHWEAVNRQVKDELAPPPRNTPSKGPKGPGMGS